MAKDGKKSQNKSNNKTDKLKKELTASLIQSK